MQGPCLMADWNSSGNWSRIWVR